MDVVGVFRNSEQIFLRFPPQCKQPPRNDRYIQDRLGFNECVTFFTELTGVCFYRRVVTIKNLSTRVPLLAFEKMFDEGVETSFKTYDKGSITLAIRANGNDLLSIDGVDISETQTRRFIKRVVLTFVLKHIRNRQLVLRVFSRLRNKGVPGDIIRKIYRLLV